MRTLIHKWIYATCMLDALDPTLWKHLVESYRYYHQDKH